MVVCFGLKQIYLEKTKLDTFLILITLFTVNHLAHFFYLRQNFKQRSKVLKISENKHGFITSVSVMLFPAILLFYENLTMLLYSYIILHLFNVSYIIIDIFNNKVKQGKKAYHNKFGIIVTSVACMYVVYRIFLDFS